MRVTLKAVLLICLFVLAHPAHSFGQTYDGDQIILSWSDNNAHTQTVTWRSASKKEGYVQYNEKGKPLSADHQVKAQITEVGESGYYRYEAVIKGLHQKTLYQYRIGDGENWSQEKTFTTAPVQSQQKIAPSDSANSFEFLYFGDVQYQSRTKDYAEWGKLLQDIRLRNPGIAFALSGGDMVNSSRKMKDWNLFLDNASSVFSYIPLMSTIGNHETSVKADPYLTMMALPENGPEGLKEEFYSFDYADCHFTVLNSCFFLENRKAAMEEEWEPQLKAIGQWLEEDLAESDAKWKILVMHHPAYGISDGDPIYAEIRERWEPIFEKGGVDLVFCGHQHLYMRTKEIGGITYVMGNSGKRRSTYYDGENKPDYTKALDATNSNYQIVKVSHEELSVISYDEEGQVIDKWTKEAERSGAAKAAVVGILLMHILAAGVFFSRKRWKGHRKKGR